MPIVSLQQNIEHFFREKSCIKESPKALKSKKKKTRRGRGDSQNTSNLKNTNLAFIGNNSAGLTGKLDSLKRIIEVFSPGVIMLQETKLKKQGKIKLNGFVIFEKLRENNDGGGLMSIVHENLKPIMISDDHSEFLILDPLEQLMLMDHRKINRLKPGQDFLLI